jgi:hypothetical protein
MLLRMQIDDESVTRGGTTEAALAGNFAETCYSVLFLHRNDYNAESQCVAVSDRAEGTSDVAAGSCHDTGC